MAGGGAEKVKQGEKMEWKGPAVPRSLCALSGLVVLSFVGVVVFPSN